MYKRQEYADSLAVGKINIDEEPRLAGAEGIEDIPTLVLYRNGKAVDLSLIHISFGALDGKLFADEVDFERDWLDDARRYLTNIVGKYGPHIPVSYTHLDVYKRQMRRNTPSCGSKS